MEQKSPLTQNLIVFPTDFSDCAKNALSYAIASAQALQAKLLVIHSIEIDNLSVSEVDPLGLLDEIKNLENKAIEKLKFLQNEAKKNGVECELKLFKVGMIMDMLPDYLESITPQLIVMGTTGADSLGKRIMGSLTYKIVINTSFPVMAVPKDAVFKKFHSIVFATDFEKKDVEVMVLLSKLASHFSAEIKVAHFIKKEKNQKEEELSFLELKQRLLEKIEYPKVDFKLYPAKDVYEGLELLIQGADIDLLALISRKLSFFERLFETSLTQKMMYHSKTPLLILS